jgi:hypothetical protein
MQPDFGLSNGREVSLWSVDQASSLISAFRVVLSTRSRFVREHARQIGKVIADLRFAEPHPDLRVQRGSFRSGTRPGVDHRTVLLAKSLA